MLYDFINEIKNKILIKGILHVGAHDGGELLNYENHSIENVVFVEANPVVYERLKNRCENGKFKQTISTYNIAISSSKNDNVLFHVTNNDSASSSILPLKHHTLEYPDINVVKSISVSTISIDELFEDNLIKFENYNVLNMDIQGAELLALTGAKNYLKHCSAIYLEVNFLEMYESCGLLKDIDNFLANFNFKRIKIIDTGRGWGDALYLKDE